MIDITHKGKSLRKATAMAIVRVSAKQTIEAVQERRIAKGDVYEFSRAAGLLAVKNTSHAIPDCHPLPVEFTSIQHRIEGLDIIITVEVQTIYRTGVEVEAMHGACITALTIYDMLKPIDKGIEILSVKLLSKKGGKSDLAGLPERSLTCAVIVCSDTIASGKKEDSAGKAIIKKLEKYRVQNVHYEIIPDESDQIRSRALNLSRDRYDLIIFCGGTGLSERDLTPDTIRPLLEREVPGIMEAARSHGQERTPYAMLSRGVAGYLKNSLVLTFPGSLRGALETMDALFPQVLHVFPVAEGKSHRAES